MNSPDYASSIRGFHRFQEVALGYDYQTTEAFSTESAIKLVTELPSNCQISFFDPKEKAEEAYIFVRRAGFRYMVMRARHGSFSDWLEVPLDRIVALFQESPLVKRPSEDFDSFRVSLIPEHQSRWHIDGADGTSQPWWKFW